MSENNVIDITTSTDVIEVESKKEYLSVREKENKDVTALIGKTSVSDIVEAVRNIPVFTGAQLNYIAEHKEHLGMIMENTFIWRTDTQKRSIINDVQHPTLHSKFHQSILEQKVQFEQSMYLAKDFEDLQLDIELKEIELAEIMEENRDASTGDVTRKGEILMQKKKLEISFSKYQLEQMKIAMHYRVDEVMGWQEIVDNLLTTMREEGIPDEVIWNKDSGDAVSLFLAYLYKMEDLATTTDPGSANNIKSLATFAFQTIWQSGQMVQIYAHHLDDVQKKNCDILSRELGVYDQFKMAITAYINAVNNPVPNNK